MAFKVLARRHPAAQLKQLITSPSFNEGSMVLANFAQASDTHDLYVLTSSTPEGYEVVPGAPIDRQVLDPGEIENGGGLHVVIGTEDGDYAYADVAIATYPIHGRATVTALPVYVYKALVSESTRTFNAAQ